jgi:DmsE family decaheme c-type cytochrome
MIKRIITTVSVLAFWGGMFYSAALLAQEPIPSYSKKGADTCAKCHDEDNEFPVYSIYKTKHAQTADQRSPFAGLQCETCHGPGADHAKPKPKGEKQAPIGTFGTKSKRSVREQNRICLDCHKGEDRVSWHSSAHEAGGVACSNCHQIHIAHDPALDTRAQPEVCYRCHKTARAQFLKPSKHPVRFGKMACSDCHQAHGSSARASLKHPTVNQACYGCHSEKRGPLLWEHAPVTEDCTICHSAHGSVQPALLKKRAPLLCQQCHSHAGHPSIPRDKDDLPVNTPSVFLLSGSCTNCHSQVHGSNHPSGIKLMR